MNENNKLIERRSSEALKEKTQYAVALGGIAIVLYFTGFPMFVIFFFGILAFFIWRTLAAPPAHGTREVFEFYLQASEILRDDEKRWFGFEIQEVIARGERVLLAMKSSPPLVHFTVGALYDKIGDHKSAERHLSFVVENNAADERTMVQPTPELRAYARALRKIEREPAESPLIATAVRALERARRNKAKTLLDGTRETLRLAELKLAELEADRATPMKLIAADECHASEEAGGNVSNSTPSTAVPSPSAKRRRAVPPDEPFGDRKPISELLRDIYDAK